MVDLPKTGFSNKHAMRGYLPLAGARVSLVPLNKIMISNISIMDILQAKLKQIIFKTSISL